MPGAGFDADLLDRAWRKMVMSLSQLPFRCVVFHTVDEGNPPMIFFNVKMILCISPFKKHPVVNSILEDLNPQSWIRKGKISHFVVYQAEMQVKKSTKTSKNQPFHNSQLTNCHGAALAALRRRTPLPRGGRSWLRGAFPSGGQGFKVTEVFRKWPEASHWKGHIVSISG